MKITEKISSNFSIVTELFEFLWKRKMWWLIPIVIVLVLFGFLMIFTQGTAIGPFIYTLF